MRNRAGEHACNGDSEGGVAMAEVGGAVKGVHSPEVLAAGVAADAALLPQEGVARELLLEDAQDSLLAGLVSVRHQVCHALVADVDGLVQSLMHHLRNGASVAHSAAGVSTAASVL